MLTARDCNQRSATLSRRCVLTGAAAAAGIAGPIPAVLAQGMRQQAAPPAAVVWDKRLSNGGVAFQPSWTYSPARDPVKGEMHVAALMRPVDGVSRVVFACDRDGPRLDIVLTQPDLALGEPSRDGTIALTLEAVCRLCGGPIDRAPNAPIGSFNYNASTRARVVERQPSQALVRIEGAALADFAKTLTRPTHYAMLGLGYATRAITLDSRSFRVIYEFQTLESDKALAELAKQCPAWLR
jgi:hypothetical protein